MENDRRADSDKQSTLGDTDAVEEHVNESDVYFNIQDDLDALSKRIDEMRDGMIHPRAARLVLEHTGISKAQAAALVETVQDVDRRTRDDNPV